jgi:hypothetical protein
LGNNTASRRSALGRRGYNSSSIQFYGTAAHFSHHWAQEAKKVALLDLEVESQGMRKSGVA